MIKVLSLTPFVLKLLFLALAMVLSVSEIIQVRVITVIVLHGIVFPVSLLLPDDRVAVQLL